MRPLIYFSSLLLILIFAACNSSTEPDYAKDITNENIIKEFLDAGFHIVSEDDSITGQVVEMTPEQASVFIERWKKFIAELPYNEPTNSRSKKMQSHQLNFLYGGGAIGIYYWNHSDLEFQFDGNSSMTNDAKLSNESIRAFYIGTSMPLSKGQYSIDTKVKHTSGYNHVLVNFHTTTTVEVNGVTLAQNCQLLSAIYVLQIPERKVLSNSKYSR